MKEQVYAITIFSDGKMRLLYFVWRNRKHKADSITFNWKTIEENGVNMHFSVVSGSFYYHILFIPSESRWYLLEVESALS